ncbi:MAG TPA: alkaline phosphatase family protein, partial [Blastocatellia bacterium]
MIRKHSANPSGCTGSAVDQIKHVVVLMFENRSFDHIFGGLLDSDMQPLVDGVVGPKGKVNRNWQTTSIYNTADPTQEPGQTNNPIYATPITLNTQPRGGFNHDFCDGMMPDLFGPGTTGYVAGQQIGAPAQTYPAMNSGFVSVNGPCFPMTFFTDGSLKVLHQLAKSFVVCDKWFCDMPGHTMPNRDFMHCATTGTLGIDDPDSGIDSALTIFDQIDKYGQGYAQGWKIYASPCTQTDASFLNWKINKNGNSNVDIAQFAKDVNEGTLPFYSFLMCWTHDSLDTSMHPSAILQPGENYLAAVYNTLVSNP